MRVFIEGVDGYVGSAVKRLLLESAAAEAAAAGEDEEKSGSALEVVGSVSFELTGGQHAPEGVAEACSRKDLAAVCELARSADAIVLDTHESVMEASAVVKALKQPFQGSKSLVLVSTLQTWSCTPLTVGSESKSEEAGGGDDEEAGEGAVQFREEDFTRRKPAAQFLLHKTLESQVLALAHDSLSTTVLAAGIVYGCEEGLLQGFYRDAWLGKRAVLPSINQGCSNVVPTVHVLDLARATTAALAAAPSQQYVVVADESHETIADIVQSIFSALQPHPELTVEEMALPAADDEDADAVEERANAWRQFPVAPVFAGEGDATDDILVKDEAWAELQCNLRFDNADGAVHGLVGEWASRQGPVANAARLAEEFRQTRALRPIRVAVLGPPLAGKSHLAQRLAEEYSLQRIDAASATEDLLCSLEQTQLERAERLAAWKKARAQRRAEEKAAEALEQGEQGDGDADGDAEAKEAEAKDGGVDADNDDDDDDDDESEEALQDSDRQAILRKSPVERLAERVKLCMDKKGNLSNRLEAKVLRVKLLSKDCLNHGFVLDGAVGSFAAMKRLFGMSSITQGLPPADPEDGDDDHGDADLNDEDDEAVLAAATEAAQDGDDAAGAALALDTRITPTAVVVLEAEDECLRERAKEAGGVSEKVFNATLDAYRQKNADHLVHTPLSFLEGECKLESLMVATDKPLDFSSAESKQQNSSDAKDAKDAKDGADDAETKSNDAEAATESSDVAGPGASVDLEMVKLYIEQGGRPFNYHPTEEERVEMQARAQAEQLVHEELQRKMRIETEAERKTEEDGRSKSIEQSRALADAHEADLLEARSEPLKDYLLKNVMPTLSQGLVETCRVKPDDPVDFLAEFLFKHSADAAPKD